VIGPRLWVSCLWAGREVTDFAYLVPQLKAARIEAVYESLEVRPNARMSERIIQRLHGIGFDGWLYVLTHQFLTRRACVEQLIDSIGQTQRRMGPDFPMVGLLHGIAAHQVPAVVRVRPCVYATDPTWRAQVSAALRNRKPVRRGTPSLDGSRFVWRVHPCYGGDPTLTAVEVGPRHEPIQYWRFAIPRNSRAVRWGVGSSGGGEISPLKFAVVRGSGRYGSHDVTWFGAANGLSESQSAYVVFDGPVPEFVCFGPAENPSGPAEQLELHRTHIQ